MKCESNRLLRCFLSLIFVICGISIFIKGFLFMRKECAIKNNQRPSFEKQFDRLILIVIDALRYDFAVKYLNKLIHNNTNYYMFKSISTPPTVTLQRIKAFTTGSLPVFIEIGSNFRSQYDITSDSLMYHFAKDNANITVLGDETWMVLYKSLISESFTSPSFDVYDLHGVDNNIIKHLPKVIEKHNSSFVIAHFLGVDHCGHVFSYQNNNVIEKINELDSFINDEIIPQLGQKDLLVVMGDHGMTDSGSHGGMSKEEIETFFYAYSPSFNFKNIPQKDSDILLNQPNVINQIDIVPTLSVLFGYPIPFLNAGKIIFDLIPSSFLRESKTLNANQIRNLLIHENININESRDKFNFYNYENDTKIEEDFLLEQGPILLKDKWTSFHMTFMILGLFLVCISLLFLEKPQSVLPLLHSLSLFSDSFIFGESLVVQFFTGLSKPSFITRIMSFFTKCREDVDRRICFPTAKIPLFSNYRLTKIIGDNYIIPTVLFFLALFTSERYPSYMYFLSLHTFFTTGHQCTLSELNIEPAYAFGHYNSILSPLLVFINNFFPFVFVTIFSRQNLMLCFYSVFSLICIMSFCIYGRYHLMIWQVITPRFLYQSFQTLIVLVISTIKYLILRFRKSHFIHKNQPKLKND